MRATRTLFGESIRKRPHYASDQVYERAAENLAKALLRDYPNEIQDNASLREELQDALTGNADGYRIARALEDYAHWEITADMVELFDAAWVLSAHQELVKEWVEAEGIEPDLAVGDKVLINASNLDWQRGQRETQRETQQVVAEVTKI